MALTRIIYLIPRGIWKVKSLTRKFLLKLLNRIEVTVGVVNSKWETETELYEKVLYNVQGRGLYDLLAILIII